MAKKVRKRNPGAEAGEAGTEKEAATQGAFPEAAAPQAREDAPTAVDALASAVGLQVGAVLYWGRFSLLPYVILNESAEILGPWKIEVENIARTLVGGAPQEIEAVMKRDGQVCCDVDAVMAIVQGESLQQHHQTTLLAIGLFVLREKGHWEGKIPALLKLIKGGKYSLAQFLETGSEVNDLDIAVLVGELAKQFGIEGDLCVEKNRRFGHRIWRAKSGEVMDLSYGERRGGFFKDEAEFQEYVKTNEALPWWERKKREYVAEERVAG